MELDHDFLEYISKRCLESLKGSEDIALDLSWFTDDVFFLNSVSIEASADLSAILAGSAL